MSIPVNQSLLSRVYSLLAPALRVGHGTPCLVCGMETRRGRQALVLDGLCPACAHALPWCRHACPACALPVAAADSGRRCGRCLKQAPPLDACHASFVYGFPLDRLLPGAKFHGDLVASRALGEWMAAGMWRHLPMGAWPQALVPVPLHRARLRQRGYDQALELARPLARRLRLPLRDDLLNRVCDTAPQSRLDAADRRRNLRRAFRVRPGVAIPAHVVLIDDVMTTGATLHEAARTLRRAGVARVDAWVCARVP